MLLCIQTFFISHRPGYENIGLFEKKIHTPSTDGKLEILTGGGTAQENWAGGGIWTENSSLGVT